MDEGAKHEREQARVAFETAVAGVRGRAIGPELARGIARAYPTVGLFMGRRAAIAEEIRTAANDLDFSFNDGRRPGAWAHVYIGLEAFDHACRSLGVEWMLPSLPAFLRDVVIPIERGAAETEVTALGAFRTFTANFRVEFTTRQFQTTERGAVVEARDAVKGEGSIIFSDALDLNEGREGTVPRKIPGDWVTGPFLDRYNEQCDRRSRPELRFASLKELSEQAAIEAGLSREAFLAFDLKRGTWRDRKVYFPLGGRPRAAFVPTVEGPIEGTIDTLGTSEPPGRQVIGGHDGKDTQTKPVHAEDHAAPRTGKVGAIGG
jgi:hypothetical protein